jgi:hypothetical protein
MKTPEEITMKNIKIDTETFRLAQVALREAPTTPSQDWQVAAMKVCRAVVASGVHAPDVETPARSMADVGYTGVHLAAFDATRAAR